MKGKNKYNMFQKHHQVIYNCILTSILFCMISCSGNSTGTDTLENGRELRPGDAFIKVSGDLNFESEAIAMFNYLTPLGEHQWFIGINNMFDNPGNDLFVMNIEIRSASEIDLPDTGTYNIGSGGTDSGIYLGVFSSLPGNSGAVAYSSRAGNGGGTLTITETTNSFVKGELEFRAVFDPELNPGQQGSGALQIDGVFYALPFN
ncbi:MAG: hypothetical protein EA359_07525 [Balneolaceae bacterium]|nr:MAG: hypothetical protein EA359_07525 [Balneolaceae bacterium]